MEIFDLLVKIKHQILSYYESLDESKKEIFNMYMIRRSSGVNFTDDSLNQLEIFEEIQQIPKIIQKNIAKEFKESKQSVKPIYYCLTFLLGYKKIEWIQGSGASILYRCYEKIQEFDPNVIIIKLEPNLSLTFDQQIDDEYIVYDKTYENAALKLIEIINNSNNNDQIVRNEAAIGLLLGYTPLNVIQWICEYEDEIRTIFCEELCDGKRISDLLTFFDTLFNNEPIISGILKGIDLPTVTKFKKK